MKKKKDNLIILYIAFGIIMLLFISFLLFRNNLIPEKKVSFDQSSFGTHKGESFKIKYNSYNREVFFTNSNEDIIDIDENGLVIAKNIGKAEIKVCLKEDNSICDTTEVIVFENTKPIEKIIINRSNEEMFVNSSLPIDVKVEPVGTNSKITWSSSNPSVATVTDGTIYAKNLGDTTITATSGNVSATILIKVVKEKKIIINFIIQDKKAINKDRITVSCLANSSINGCNIDIPSFNVNKGYEVVGFSNTPNNAIINVRKDESIIAKSDKDYYVVTRKTKPLDATFIIQNDTAEMFGYNSRCYFYNGNDTCDVTAPNLVAKNGNKVLGWSTDKDATTASIKVGEIIKVDNNTKLYSVTEKVINVTYSENEDIDGVNIKASKLSFNNNKNTRCTSYNGNGCYIVGIPTVYSKGNIVHGFSLTKNGESIPVLQTKFTEDTTLYARIHNDLNDKEVFGYDVAYETQIGNIIIEFEKGLTINGTITFINFLNELYKDHPELFYFDGKIVLLTEDTYVLYNEDNSSGITWTDDNGYFSTVFIRYNTMETFENRYLGTIVHELAHCYDNKYMQIFGKNISKEEDIITLYNKYVNASNRPLSSYAYTDNNRYEFIAEALLEVYRLDKQEEGLEPYRSQMDNVYVTDDIKDIIHKYLDIGNNYFKEKGMIS